MPQAGLQKPRMPLPLTGPAYAVITAAGSSIRFGEGKKELFRLPDGKTVLQTAIEAFFELPDLKGIIITCPPGSEDTMKEALGVDFLSEAQSRLEDGLLFCPGGAQRQDSVFNALSLLMNLASQTNAQPDSTLVLIHDGARPWVSRDLVAQVANAARTSGACIPLVDLADTPKVVSIDGTIAQHPDRASIRAAQTPQAFALGPLYAANLLAIQDQAIFTDDSALWDRYIGMVQYIPGERDNKKITYKEDIPAMSSSIFEKLRIGEGWDIHPLVPGRPLLLGGVRIENPVGEDGHSDADVLWHAIIDAVLGAAGLGDIGTHFPPSDHAWKNADSGRLAKIAAKLVREAGFSILNIDTTVILESPRLGPHKEAIREQIASVLEIPVDCVSVKAKTAEKFGAVGAGIAIEARAVALLARHQSN